MSNYDVVVFGAQKELTALFPITTIRMYMQRIKTNDTVRFFRINKKKRRTSTVGDKLKQKVRYEETKKNEDDLKRDRLEVILHRIQFYFSF